MIVGKEELPMRCDSMRGGRTSPVERSLVGRNVGRPRRKVGLSFALSESEQEQAQAPGLHLREAE